MYAVSNMRRACVLSWFLALAGTLAYAGSAIAKGTKIYVRFEELVSSANARTGDTFTALLARDLKISPDITIAAGAIVRGRVTRSQAAAIDGTTAGTLVLVVDSIESGSARYYVTTKELVRRGRPVSGKNTRDPARRQEIQNTVADTLGRVAHPDPRDVPGADGNMQANIELQSVEGSIPAHSEWAFTTISTK
jgi:hypothetical protein